MASSNGSRIPFLIVGALAISSLGLTTINTIRANLTPAQAQRAAIFTGDLFMVTADNTTPEVYVDGETAPVVKYPTLPGQEYCTGNTGALQCSRLVKLTSSGGLPKYNAGSFQCATQTCSGIRALVMTEGSAKGDALYIGWTNSPGTASGKQIMFQKATASGLTLAAGTGGELSVPAGATVKAVFKTLTPGKIDGAVLYTYTKFWTK